MVALILKFTLIVCGDLNGFVYTVYNGYNETKNINVEKELFVSFFITTIIYFLPFKISSIVVIVECIVVGTINGAKK